MYTQTTAIDGLIVETVAPDPTESLNSTENVSDEEKGYGFNVQAPSEQTDYDREPCLLR